MPHRTMTGPKPDQPQSRVNPLFRAYGDRITELVYEEGFATLGQFWSYLASNPQRNPHVAQGTFMHLLNGRRNSTWERCYEAIILALAEKRLRRLASGTLESNQASIRNRIYTGGDTVSERTEYDIGPSFCRLESPGAPAAKADDFLDVKAPTLADMWADFDIPRNIYTRELNGIKTRTLSALAATGADPHLFTISGPSGSGKTVVSMRLAFDCLQAGYDVFSLQLDWSSPIALAQQIRDLVARSSRPTLFIFDGAARLERSGLSLLDVYRSLAHISHPVVLLGIETWRLFPVGNGADGATHAHWPMDALTADELDRLVDQVIRIECSGKVDNIRCDLSRQDRLNLCVNDRDRSPATALLMFRYGRSVDTILLEELRSLGEGLTRDVYVQVITCAGLDLDIPETVIARRLRQATNRPTDFWQKLKQITATRENCVGLRHRLFFRYIAPHTIPDINDRATHLLDIVSLLSDEQQAEHQFAQALFSKIKPIGTLLRRKEVAVRLFITQGLEMAPGLSEEWRSDWLTCLGRLAKNVLDDHETAEKCFVAAIEADDFNKFAYRERSWNLLSWGRYDEAEQAARKAAGMFPGDTQTLRMSAMVLQYTGESGFTYANDVFNAAVRLDPTNEDVVRWKDRYDEASALRKYIPTIDMIDAKFLKVLHAPWFVWKIKKGLGSTECKQEINRKLTALLQDHLVDTDQLTGLSAAAGTDFARALIKANLARAAYVQWQNDGVETDFEAIESMFKEAMQDAPSEPFIKTWYGTFLKEVRENMIDAEEAYRQAIKIAKDKGRKPGAVAAPVHPMLLNNLALLLIKKARTAYPNGYLKEAKRLLERAVETIEETGSKFRYPYDELDKLKRLMAELGIV